MSEQKKQLNAKAGFTLVELLVVLAITLMMTGIMFAMTSTSSAPKDVDAAAQQIVAQLRLLQNESLSGFKLGGASGPIVHSFEFDSLTNAYQMKYFDSSHTQLGSTSQPVYPKLVTLTPSVITFTSPWATLTTTAASITITSTKNASVVEYVCVFAGGNILTSTKNATCS